MSTFLKKCRNYFVFLNSEFGCSNETESSVYGVTIYYKNTTSCVKIMEERGNIFISLAKLKNGNIPEYSTKTQDKSKVNFIDLLTIIKAKNPKDCEYYDKIFDIKRKKLDFKLEKLSKALKLYAEDFLNGDFSIFDTLI